MSPLCQESHLVIFDLIQIVNIEFFIFQTVM